MAEREHILRKAMAEREQTLQEAIVDRERQLASLQEVMADRERQLEESLADRDWQLATVKGSLAERDRQLSSLQRNLAASQRRLQSLRSSISWKLTSPFRELRRAAVRIVGLFRRPKQSSDVALSELANSDLAVPDEIATGLTEPARLLYRNLRDAAAFQRRTGKKRISGKKRV